MVYESPYIGKSQHAKDRPNWPANPRTPASRRSPPRRHDRSPDSLDSEVCVSCVTAGNCVSPHWRKLYSVGDKTMKVDAKP